MNTHHHSMRGSRRCVVASAVVLVGGALQPSVLIAQTVGGGTPPFARVTPYTELENNYETTTAAPHGSDFSDAYTRLYITTAVESPTQTLPYKSRNIVRRFFLGRESSVNLTLSVESGVFAATVPLLTLYQKSDGSGEQWTRTLYTTAENFPLFLVGASGENGTPTIKASLKGSLGATSQIAGSAVNVVLGVARAVGPEAKVVTSLSKTQLRNQAEAVDTALSKLFDRAIDESTTVDQDLRYWHAGGAIKLHLKVPKKDFVITSDSSQVDAGTWQIGFESPRPSLFVDWRICTATSEDDPDLLQVQKNGRADQMRCKPSRKEALIADFKEVDAASVLSTNLTNLDSGLGQVSSYLAQQTWYKTAVPKLAANSSGKINCTTVKGASACAPSAPTVDPETVDDFCRQIYTTIRTVGLSTADAAIVTWAVYRQNTDIPAAARTAMASSAVCSAWIKPIEIAQGVVFPPPAPAPKPLTKKAAA